MSVVNDVCEAIAARVAEGCPGVDARPGPGGALKAPAFYLVVLTSPVRTTARKRDWSLRGILLLGDLGPEAVRQGREYIELIPSVIEGPNAAAKTLGGLVDWVSCSTTEEIGGDEYQQLDGWAVAFDIDISGRTS